MAYRYKLEVLLRLQRSREKQEENRLLACASKVAALNSEIELLKNAGLARKRAVQEEMRAGVLAAVLRTGMVWEEAARKRADDLSVQRRMAIKAQQEQLGKYRTVRQKRETLESLKDRQRAAYEAEDSRRMQQSMDEMYLARLKPSEIE